MPRSTLDSPSAAYCDDRVVVTFFSRGRGRGHAIPDMALLDEVRKIDGRLDARWVSYGTGAETIRAHGHDVIDLDLPDENPFLETQLRSTRLLADLRPQLVISHEEFAALPAARLFGIPTVFITDYFLGPGHLWMQCVNYATEIIVIDDEEICEQPSHLRGRSQFVGPLIPNFTYTLSDRYRARVELGLPIDAKILLVLPGGWFTEARAPIFNLVLSAYRALVPQDKRLVWFAGHDCGMLEESGRAHPDLIVKHIDWQIDRWMVASDLVITKGNRQTTMELAYLGVPSISLSHGLNIIDDKRVSRIASNTHLNISEIDAYTLTAVFERVLSLPPQEATASPTKGTGLLTAAQRLADTISRTRKLRKTPIQEQV